MLLQMCSATPLSETRREKNTTSKGLPKSTFLLMANLGVFTLCFLIAQPDFLIAKPNIDPRTTAEHVQGTQDMVFITITRVAAFAVCEGSPPRRSLGRTTHLG
ncbi:MAG: hypothetical protein OSA81_04390 [Longimicrobiales bacterium]|nr:hypothetical protein [Longimicrobiales bacterium]